MMWIHDSGASMSICFYEMMEKYNISINHEEEYMNIVGMARSFVTHPQAVKATMIEFLVMNDISGNEFLLG